MKKTFLFLAALAMSAMMMAAEKITTVAGITSGNKYYIGATNSSKDYYFYVDGSAKTESIKGVAKEDVADAVALTFTAVTDGWTIQFENDLYLGIKNAKDNGAVQVVEDAVVWTIDEDTDKGLLKLHPNDYYLQKNNGGTQFGSYKNTQTNVWLESAGAAPVPATLDSIVIKGKAEKMEYEVGEAFDPAGLEVWGYYTKVMKHDSTSQIKSGITWTLDPETFEEASDNESVTLVASYKELTTADTTITGINVTEPAPLPKYATIYTSNVTLSTTGGTSATAAKVVVAKGDTVDALKAGTGSAAGVLVVNIPAATKTLHFHVVGWSGKSVELDINGEALAITSDAGISNNSPFTLTGTASDYYYAIDPKGATTITFKATKDYRFVLFGVNAELEEGVIAAPAFNPTDTDFDGSVEVTLTCETEGAEIFYALNEEVTSMNATKYTEPIKLTATTTIYAVAKKDGKESAPANKTYTLAPVYTLAELVAAGAPTTAGKKVILILDDEEITKLYTNKSEEIAGIYVKSGAQEVEIYQQNYAFPKTWEVKGKVSGRIMGDWVLYNSTWELKIAQDQVANLSYTASDPYAKEPKETIQKTLNYTNLYVDSEEGVTPIYFYAFDEMTYDDIELQFNMAAYNLPAGTYSVANTGAANTIQAATGEVFDYIPVPTYVGFYDQYFNLTPYFITGGSVNVAYSSDGKTIYMTGTLTSAHGSTFTLNLSGENTLPYSPTALQQVMMNGNIRKAMHNGHIMILKGDKMFNLHGMLVK